jgi:hypothetical protein
MAKKVRKWNDKSGRRPIIGGVLLSLAVLAGLTVFLLFGAEHQRWSSNDPTSDALIFIFIPAVLVDNDDNMYYIYAVVIAFASVALIGAVYSILRREWSLAWIGSLFGTIFGPLTLIGVYLIGTSDLEFRRDSVLGKLRSSRDGSSPRKNPFVGVIAVVLASLLIGRSLSVILVSITDALALSLLIGVGFLILMYLAVTAVHSRLKS